MPEQSTKPTWQSTVIAVVLMAIVGGSFVVVFLKSGMDSALKAWAGLGTLVGVLTGAVPMYFFQQAAVQRANTVADTAQATLHDCQQQLALARIDLRDAQAKLAAQT